MIQTLMLNAVDYGDDHPGRGVSPLPLRPGLGTGDPAAMLVTLAVIGWRCWS